MSKKSSKQKETDFGDAITLSEAARLRGVSRNAISSLVKRGRLHSKRIFNNVVVSRSEVLAFERMKPGPSANSEEAQ
jgi:predicted DNA-binding protein YlxM (UPF0122 family)